MSLKDKLEIILITYNRKKFLTRTLEQLFAENSPIKNLDITILNNVSTDGSTELINEYCQKYPNIKHIIHNHNIGGNANIARAFEIASKDYVWVLCDDDEYNFKHWNEIEDAILSNEYDCILTEWKYSFKNTDYPYIINTLAFVPAGIYKTKNITTTVMHNIYSNIMYSFPQLALGCSLLNNNKKFYIPHFRVVKQKINQEFKRGCNNELHFRQANTNLFSGYINSYQMITNKQLRKKCCNVLWIGKSFYHSMKAFLNSNDGFIYNISDVFWGISPMQKVIFLITFVQVYTLQSIFSLKNSVDKRHKIITLLGMKLKIKNVKTQ